MKRVTAILLSFVLAIALCGCADKAPSRALAERIDAMIEQSATAQGDDTATAIMRKVAQNIEYKLGKQKIQGNKATVEISVTTIDVAALITKAAEVYNAAENKDGFSIEGWIAAEIIKPEIAKVSKKATVYMVLTEDEGWIIDESASLEELADAITGGYFGAINGVEQQ